MGVPTRSNWNANARLHPPPHYIERLNGTYTFESFFIPNSFIDIRQQQQHK